MDRVHEPWFGRYLYQSIKVINMIMSNQQMKMLHKVVGPRWGKGLAGPF